MNDTLYQLLNNDATDLPPAEPISDQEVMHIMKRLKEEKTIRASQTGRKPKISAALLAAAITAASVGTATVAAAKLGIFSKLNNAQEQTFEWNEGTLPLDKFENRYHYDWIAQNAVEPSEAVRAEGDNLVVNVSEVYCDGCTTIISLSGSLKDGNPDRKRLLNLNHLKVTVNGQTYSDENKDTHPAILAGNLTLDEDTENHFSGTIQLVDFGDRAIMESSVLEIQVGNVSEQENYMDYADKTSSGFTLAVTVTPDKTLRYDNVYTIEEDGYFVRFYEIAPAMMIIGLHSTEEWESWLYNENGLPIEGFGLVKLPDHGDGFSICCTMPVTSGTLVASFYDKSGNHGMPDKNDRFPSIKEITINMDEVYAALRGNS